MIALLAQKVRRRQDSAGVALDEAPDKKVVDSPWPPFTVSEGASGRR